MNDTLLFKGHAVINSPVIDKNLPTNCKTMWSASGALVHDSLRRAYLDMVVAETTDGEVSTDECYLMLAGRLPVVRNKRRVVGRNHLLTKHSLALDLFGCLAHSVDGRLKVGFLGLPDDMGKAHHSMRVVKSSDDDLSFIINILNEWAKNLYLGDNSESGYGDVSFEWFVSKGLSDIGFIKIDNKGIETNISF